MGWESFYVVRFDLGPLLQGQTRIPKLKSAYILSGNIFGLILKNKMAADLKQGLLLAL